MEDERLTYIDLCGKRYPLMLNVYATKQIVKKYGGLAEVGTALENATFEEQLESVLWLLTTLINAGIMFCNYQNGTKEPLISQELIEAVSSPLDFMAYRDAAFTAMNKGAARNIRNEETLGGDSKNA